MQVFIYLFVFVGREGGGGGGGRLWPIAYSSGKGEIIKKRKDLFLKS